MNMSDSFKEKRLLGKTGMRVSRLGIASGYGISAKAVERAYYEFGVNYFLWSSPRREGMENALRNLVITDRENIVIAIQTYDHSGFFASRSVEKGLKELGADYADILILGWHNSMPSKRLINAALKLKEKGRIRHIGMSGHRRATFGAMAVDNASPVDVFMVRYNAVHAGAETEIFPFLREENRPGITVYTATCWRRLLDPKRMPRGERPLTASDCYRFVLSNPHVDLCLMGPSTELQMEGGLEALVRGPLAREEMARIRAIGEHIHGK